MRHQQAQIVLSSLAYKAHRKSIGVTQLPRPLSTVLVLLSLVRFTYAVGWFPFFYNCVGFILVTDRRDTLIRPNRIEMDGYWQGTELCIPDEVVGGRGTSTARKGSLLQGWYTLRIDPGRQSAFIYLDEIAFMVGVESAVLGVVLLLSSMGHL